MRRTIAIAVLTTTTALAALPAGAVDLSSVDQISATPGSSLAVTGSATFRDVPVDTGTDAAADSDMPGTDLTKASISAPVNGRLRFRLTLGNAIPEISSSPAAVFLWPITIDGNSDNLFLHASRFRVGAPPNTPHLRVVRIADGITTVATVNGTMAGDIVEWDVSLGNISAQAGSVVTSEGLIRVAPGMSGAAHLNGADFDDMSAETEYTVPGRKVLLGTGPAAASPESIALTTPATVSADGAFSATMPMPVQAGAYQVVAQACYGPLSCGTGSATFTV